MATTISDIFAIEPSPDGKPNTFISKHKPVRLGNAANIAYGGCALACSINAATATIDLSAYRLYSVVGHYLGAASTDLNFSITVTPLRDTRTFATRSVLVSQYPPNTPTKARHVLAVQLDFHRPEPATLKTFSPPPPPLATSLHDSWDQPRAMRELAAHPDNTPQLLAAYERTFAAGRDFYDLRSIPTSIHAQNMYGLLKRTRTSQDALTLPEKASFEWSRSATPLNGYAQSISALGFWMDGGIAFVPLTHDHQFLTDAAAASSLDFALRIFVNDFDYNEWHVRELKAVTAGEGRSFGRASMWDQKGTLVAEMSQQCILRPKPAGKAKAKM